MTDVSTTASRTPPTGRQRAPRSTARKARRSARPRGRHGGAIQRAATLLLVAATLFAGLLGAVPVPRARAGTPAPGGGELATGEDSDERAKEQAR